MTIEALNWAFARHDIRGSARAVLLVLANRADAGGVCWPSQETIALESGFSDRTVRTALAELADLGAIEFVRSGTYRICREAENSSGRNYLEAENSSGVKSSADRKISHLTGKSRRSNRKNFPTNPKEPTIEPKVLSRSEPELLLEGEPVPRKPKTDQAFDAFWAAYPRRQDRGHAEKAWATALKTAPPNAIMAGLEKYSFSPDPKFIPLAATWLNGRRWTDEPAPQPKNPELERFEREMAWGRREIERMGLASKKINGTSALDTNRGNSGIVPPQS